MLPDTTKSTFLSYSRTYRSADKFTTLHDAFITGHIWQMTSARRLSSVKATWETKIDTTIGSERISSSNRLALEFFAMDKLALKPKTAQEIEYVSVKIYWYFKLTRTNPTSKNNICANSKLISGCLDRLIWHTILLIHWKWTVICNQIL